MIPKFGNRAADQESTEDYSDTEGHHENNHGVCNCKKCFVRAENCDVEMHDGYLD